jgi:hypothetical protein
VSTCAAQSPVCKPDNPSTVEHREGVTLRRVSFVEPAGKIGASIFIPESSAPVPGIIFSHSSARDPDESWDLLTFAWALARAGAASIVLDGTLEWQVPNDNSGPAQALIACAGEWLLLNASLDKQRLAAAVPDRLWNWDRSSICEAVESPCWFPRGGITLGSARMNSASQLRAARFLQRLLQLKEMQPEWLIPIDKHSLAK